MVTRVSHLPNAPEVVVDGAEGLDRLRDPGRKRTIRRIRLAGPLNDAALERRINRAYFACGCQTGSVAVALTMLTCLVGAVVTGLGGAFGPWRILGYMISAALVGKVTGLAVARVELRRVERRLRQRIAETCL